MVVAEREGGVGQHPRFGGKGNTLLRLRETFPVPPFVTVGAAEFGGAKLPAAVAEFIAGFGDDEVFAVRSSADVEDSPTLSFAGLFDTVLGASRGNVEAAIAEVRDGVRRARVRAYCDAHGIDADKIEMNVVIQRAVPADRSGVAFSQSGTDPDPLCVLIEAVYGLGEPLVQGTLSPDSWTLGRSALEVRSHIRAHQGEALQLCAGGGTEQVVVPSTARRAAKLSAAQVDAVGRLVLEVEQWAGGRAVDIEWAYEGARLWLLQARPLTRAGDSRARRGSA